MDLRYLGPTICAQNSSDINRINTSDVQTWRPYPTLGARRRSRIVTCLSTHQCTWNRVLVAIAT